jgi:hypothetical protein
MNHACGLWRLCIVGFLASCTLDELSLGKPAEVTDPTGSEATAGDVTDTRGDATDTTSDVQSGCAALVWCGDPDPIEAVRAAHQWSKRFGDGNSDSADAIAIDPAGNVYVTGSFRGTVDFGGGPLPGTSGASFVASFSPEGEHRWSRHFPGGAHGLAVSETGEVYVGGSFSGTIDFGGGPLTAAEPYGAFVTSYTSVGDHRWSRTFGSGSISIGGVAVDGLGNVYLTGSIRDTLDFGGGPLTNSSGVVDNGHDVWGSDSFVASLSSDGEHRFSRHVDPGPEGSSFVGNAALDDAGNVYVSGGFSGAVDLGGGILTGDVGLTPSTRFAASYTAEGTHRWSKLIDHSYGSPTVDGTGNIYVAGGVGTDEVDFGGGPLAPISERDGYVASFTTQGAHRWSTRFGESDFTDARLTAVDPAGNVYVSRSSSESPFVEWKRSIDIYTPQGELRCSLPYPDLVNARIAFDPACNVYATGSFLEPVDFGGGPLTSAGESDIFVVRLGS